MHYERHLPFPRGTPIPTPWVMTVAEVLAPAVSDRRTRDRIKLDVRSLPPPDTTWLNNFLNPPVSFDEATWPAIDEVVRSFTASQAARINTRSIPQPLFSWVTTANDETVQTHSPIWRQELSGFRAKSRDGSPLDVRNVSEPDFNWILRPNAFDNQWWPGVEELLHSFRTTTAAAIDTANVQQPLFSWTYPVVDNIVSSRYPAIAAELISHRSRDRALLSQRVHVPDPLFDWMINHFQPAFDATLWPGIEQLLRSFRSQDATKIGADINEPHFSWFYNIIDSDIALKLGPLFNGGFRAEARAKPFTNSVPNFDWLFENLPAASPYDDSFYPALTQLLQSYRSAEAARLTSQHLASPYAVPTFILLAEVLAPGLGGFRARDRAAIDLRAIAQSPAAAYIFENLPAPFNPLGIFPSVLSPQFRARDRDKIDVTRIIQPSETAWYLQAAEALACYLISSRTDPRANIDVRAITEPNTDWLFAFLDSVPYDPTTWPPIEQLLKSFRSLDTRRLQVDEPDPAWIFSVPVPQLIPIDSFRSKDARSLDVRSVNEPDFSWVFQAVTAAFDPALWPAIEELIHVYRVRSRSRLDVTAVDQPDFEWVQQVIDADLAPLWPAIEMLLRVFRARERSKIRVGSVNEPDFGWLFPNLPPIQIATGRRQKRKWRRGSS